MSLQRRPPADLARLVGAPPDRFDLVASLLVVNEARLGDPEAAQRRLALLEEVTLLEVTHAAQHIANAEILPRVAMICERFGLALPYVCTPEELLGESQ